MSDRLPHLPLFVDDYDAATAHLTIEEDGAYMRLLRLCWRTPGCSIPDDDAWIRRRMRCDQSTYDCVVKPIIDEFFTRKGGRVFQRRLQKEHEYALETRKKRQEAGSKGGKANALNNNDTDPSNAQAGLKHPTQPNPTQKKASSAPADFSFLDACIEALGEAADPTSTGFNLVAINQWREQGCSDQHILEWLKARAANLPRMSVRHFGYFKTGPVDALNKPPPKQADTNKASLEHMAELKRRREEDRRFREMMAAQGGSR